MIKRRFFPLMCVVASLMSLTSCFPDHGYSSSSDFARVVTINRAANPLQLDADYTGEVFKLDNLTRLNRQPFTFGVGFDLVLSEIRVDSRRVVTDTMKMHELMP